MSMEFYSARLLFIILVDDGKPRKSNHFDESVVVFRAKDLGQAFKRALQLGKSSETTYLNQRGQKVRWTLAEVVSLDWVGREIDGKEVASKLHYRTQSRPIPSNRQFHPERSKPTQTF
jgi:hypothetical protein